MDNENKNQRRRYIKKDLLLDIGKLPPQAIELEENVLGVLMTQNEFIHVAMPIIEADYFYNDKNQRIYSAIVSLVNKSITVDILSVVMELKRTGELELAGGAYYITGLSNSAVHGGNMELYCRIISQKHIQRKLIINSSKTIQDAYDEQADVFELLDNAEKSLTQLTSKVNTTKIDTIAKVYNKWADNNDKLLNAQNGLSGIPSGFRGVDALTGGWQKADLVIIAARPGMGKTSLMTCMVRNAAVDFKKPIAVFSVEMSKIQLIARLMAQETGMNTNKYTRYGLKEDEFINNSNRCSALIDANIFIDDTPALTLFELRNKCRKLVRENKIEAIFIDYLQIMKSGTKTNGKTEEVGLISNALKALAKELDLPVIALSQLSRDNEKRGGDRRPSLTDLRNSGEIEQDADTVIFIHRPEYYGEYADSEGNSTVGKAALIVEKNRSGPVGTAITNWIAEATKFVDGVEAKLNEPGFVPVTTKNPSEKVEDQPF